MTFQFLRRGVMVACALAVGLSLAACQADSESGATGMHSGAAASGPNASPADAEQSFKQTVGQAYNDVLDHIDRYDFGSPTYPATEADTSDVEALVQQKRDEGKLVLEGTIRQFNRQELLAFQGEQDPDPGIADNSTYTVFALSEPQDLMFRSGDGYQTLRTKRVNVILLFNASGGVVPEDQPVFVAFDASETRWPSDTRLPVGQPGSVGYEILK